MDIFPKCEVCHEHFTLKGPAPYLLPCLHVVCETCVTSTARGALSCSTCQKEVSLTETHLQKDVVRQREIFHLTVQHRPSELLCTHEDDDNQAVCWCHECEEFLCEYCQNLHEGFKAMRTHTVKEIGEIQPGLMNNEQFCSIHKSQTLDFWDRACDVLICSRCRRDEHDGHDFEDVSVAADTSRKDIEEVKARVLMTKENQRLVVETNKAQLKHADENAKIVKDKINHTFQSLKTCLEQREKEILLEQDEKAKAESEVLIEETTVSESGQLQCQTAIEYIDKALLLSSKHDIITILKTIREISQTCLATPEKTQNCHLFDFNTDGLAKLKTAVTCFGKISAVEYDASSPEFSRDNGTRGEAGDVITSANIQNPNIEKTELLVKEVSTLQARIKELETSETTLTRQKQETEATLTKQKRESEQKVGLFEKHCVILETEMRKQGLYCLKRGKDKPFCFLHCTHLELDKSRVNLKSAFINTEGKLTNDWSIMSRLVGQQGDRLHKYEGTCSTSPLPRTGSSQYWETRSEISLAQTLQDSMLILELGLSREEEHDQSHRVYALPHSYSLTVSHCIEHKGVCRKVRKHGQYIHCLPDTLSNKPGTAVSLNYGVIYDDARNTVAFLDINERKIIAVLDNVDSSCPLWSMFGVYNRGKVNISMKLVTGEAIDMTQDKTDLILEALP